MALQRYAVRCEERRQLLGEALGRVLVVCRAEPEVRSAYVFGSYAAGKIGPTSDLDVLIVRDTQLGIVDRVADLKLASRGRTGIDLVVVTPDEFRTTFRASSFGRSIIETARRVYAA